MSLWKRLLFFVPVIAGVLFVVTMVKNKQEPNRPETKERSRVVSAFRVEPTSVVPRVVGYGYVEPIETWAAIPEVSGKVIERHPELKKGAFFSKGDLLLQLDPQSYGLAETRGVASVMSVDAQLKELEQQRKNTERLIEIEKEALQLTQKELERKRELTKKGFLSQSELDLEEKNLLSQETSLKNLYNTLDLIPSQKRALLAQKDSDESSLTEMQLDVERTIIRAPFDCRISAVHIELGEFAQVGTTLIEAINIAEVEIPVQLAPNEFVNLLAAPFDVAEIVSGAITMDTVRKMINIDAEVRLPMFHREAAWPAIFRRTGESVDVATGALTVYVAVEKPYEKIEPGVRPPLVPTYLATYAGGHHTMTKRTPVHEAQTAAGGIFRRIGVWERVRYFSEDLDCKEEINNVRTNVGLLDASTLGKFRIHGPDALKALQRVYVSDMARAAEGRIKYAAMCNDDGCVIDDGVVVKLAENDYYFTTSTGRAGQDGIFTLKETGIGETAV